MRQKTTKRITDNTIRNLCNLIRDYGGRLDLYLYDYTDIQLNKLKMKLEGFDKR